MKLWILIHLEEGDKTVALVDKLINLLTSMGFTKPGQTISYERVGNTLLIYRRG